MLRVSNLVFLALAAALVLLVAAPTVGQEDGKIEWQDGKEMELDKKSRKDSTIFQDFDVLLCPISPVAAFPHDHSPFPGRTLLVDGHERPYFEQVFWAGLITVAYLPSTVFPTGPSREGLPIGLQAVCPEFHDHTCIDFARLVTKEFGGFTPPPGYDD